MSRFGSVDILAGVRSLEESRAYFEPLAQLGYMYAPYPFGRRLRQSGAEQDSARGGVPLKACSREQERKRPAEGVNKTRTSVHRARVVWDPSRDDRRAHTIDLANQRLAASGAAALGGDPDRADPEEMFVASLSSCHMLWFLSLARAARLQVTAYEDEPEGTMDGTRFTRVVLRPKVAFDGDVDDAQVDSLHHRAHERCFIANSVNCAVEVESRSSQTQT